MSVLLSGCAGAPGGNAQAVGPARIVEGYDCLAPNLAGWALPPDSTSTPDPQHPDAPEAGRVPAGFTPVKVVRCELMASIEDAEGRWSGVTEATLTGDLAPLLAALSEPDDEKWLGPCTADMELVPPLWLVDATGAAIHAHYPRDGCAKTKPAARDALAGLTVRETTAMKQTLVEPRAALDSGCRAEWTAPFDEERLLSISSTDSFPGIGGKSPVPSTPPTSTPPTKTPPTSTLPTDLDGMRWCRYAVEPDPSGAPESSGTAAMTGAITLRTGQFVAGGTLDPATAQLVAGVAAFEPVPRSCDATATMFLVLVPIHGGHELEMTFTAELDGCELLSRDGSGTRPLPDDVRELLTAQTAL
ncbi:hypothetical protein [Cryobacterium zongtaii]|uniref:hypothetical protein n=1 Tax=Cryobacterium zongtaii TaxID=1259217 RepID=UPI001056EC44|nr:hypothetical protein [Cryobacterium zongtaii]